ncbi:MAG TPA: MgtC/SapB family protein [Rhodocyclaceae bacterium]|nr:MgtC/SapB family protein [Rhodocyclaceae bacterium]
MSALSPESLAAYWSGPEVAANVVVFLNLFGALLLGLLVGYERSYHGRAAGMRTYGLVCMASAALTVISGYPNFWYGGHAMAATAAADPTRVIQGIVTGVGFLGAGVIMKEGLNISGLTTAASIWASSAIGVLVGIGFYAAAILLALLSAACMMWISRLEAWLPSRQAIGIMLRFRPESVPQEDTLRQSMLELGYDIAWGSLQITCQDEKPEWRFVAVALGKGRGAPIPDIAQLFSSYVGLDCFQVSHARN